MSSSPLAPWPFTFESPPLGPMDDGPRMPGYGLPPRPGEGRPGLSPWGRLAKEGAIGHSTNFDYDATRNGPQEAATDMCLLRGDDFDACQIVVTLSAPRAIPQQPSLIIGNVNNATGEEGNSGFSAAELFPGTTSPIAWPPFEAVVEWGTGGHKHIAFVDFINGTQFSVAASYLRMKAAVGQSQANGFKGSSGVYSLAGTTGPGWTRGNATKTIYVGEVAPSAESPVYAIPPYARRATAYLCDNGAVPNVTAGFLRFWQSPDGVVGGNSTGNAFVSGNTPGPFVLPAGAAYFSFYNQGAVGMVVAIVFDLALG